MNEDAFREFLSHHRNEAANADDLVAQVREFEKYLDRSGRSLMMATPDDLKAYAGKLGRRAGEQMRGLTFYYEWQGNVTLGPAAREYAPGRGPEGEPLVGHELSGSMPTNNARGGQEALRKDEQAAEPHQDGVRTPLKDPIEDDSNWGMDGR